MYERTKEGIPSPSGLSMHHLSFFSHRPQYDPQNFWHVGRVLSAFALIAKRFDGIEVCVRLNVPKRKLIVYMPLSFTIRSQFYKEPFLRYSIFFRTFDSFGYRVHIGYYFSTFILFTPVAELFEEPGLCFSSVVIKVASQTPRFFDFRLLFLQRFSHSPLGTYIGIYSQRYIVEAEQCHKRSA